MVGRDNPGHHNKPGWRVGSIDIQTQDGFQARPSGHEKPVLDNSPGCRPSGLTVLLPKISPPP